MKLELTACVLFLCHYPVSSDPSIKGIRNMVRFSPWQSHRQHMDLRILYFYSTIWQTRILKFHSTIQCLSFVHQVQCNLENDPRKQIIVLGKWVWNRANTGKLPRPNFQEKREVQELSTSWLFCRPPKPMKDLC